MKKITCAVLDQQRKFSFQTVELPEPGEGEVLIKISMATICRSDWHTFSGARETPLPSVLGHEACGIVERLPSKPVFDIDGNPLNKGDRVVWTLFAVADYPEFAERGIIQKSPGVQKYGHLSLETAPASGGFASHILLRKGTGIARLGADIPPEVAAPLNCSLATMVGAFRLGGVDKKTSVAILGCGMLGLHGLAYAKMQCFHSITGVETDVTKKNKALQFGADRVFSPEEWSGITDTFDLIIDTTGVTALMQRSVEKLAIGGTAVWVGAVFPSEPVPVDPEMLIRKVITIRGLHNYNTEDFRQAVAHLEKHYGDFPFDSLVNPLLPLNKLGEAFEAYKKKDTYRVGIIP